jgi:hypothetical protein
MLLALIGNSEVTWKNDSYRSSVTTINLQTDEIVMEGTIKGTVNG